MMKNRFSFQRLLAVCLALLCCFGCCTTAFAADEPAAQNQTVDAQQAQPDASSAPQEAGDIAPICRTPELSLNMLKLLMEKMPWVFIPILLFEAILDLPSALFELLREAGESVYEFFYFDVYDFFSNLFS